MSPQPYTTIPWRAGTLHVGDKVAIVSPAASADPSKINRGCERLRARGYQPVVMPHAKARGPLYYAGTIEQRLSDLHAAFADPSIKAILCTRGGWGSAELLPLLDKDLIHSNPKLFVGYSDYTSLHVWLWNECRLHTVYGPMVAADWSLDHGEDDRTWSVVMDGHRNWSVGPSDGLRVLREGPSAEGRLLGGCLAIIEAGLGTPWALRIDEPCVLFLEDINVKPYQWDRMLQHLRWAGLMQHVTAIVLGDMTANVKPEEMPLLESACLHALRDVPGPVLIGLRSGHVIGGNRSLPLGTWVSVDNSIVREIG
ncbi:MAG: LD-carboxypeptidase [Acidobacteriaceae bacterium]